jgi:hypothetical protein
MKPVGLHGLHGAAEPEPQTAVWALILLQQACGGHESLQFANLDDLQTLFDVQKSAKRPIIFVN